MKDYPNFTERAVPKVSANFLMMEAISRYSFASKYVNKNSLVLDMACGSGYGTDILGKKSSYAIGLDINSEAIELSKEYLGNKVGFLKMDVTNTLFSDSTFDVICGFEMIEHLDSTNKFLKEVSRLLKKGGIFIVSTPNRLTQSPSGTPMSPYHLKEYSPDELDVLLTKYFPKTELYGQSKNEKAKEAVSDFMNSQKIRQLLVDIDVLNIRKIINRSNKEALWKKFGALFGRASQENVDLSDYLIKKNKTSECEYIIAVCRK